MSVQALLERDKLVRSKHRLHIAVNPDKPWLRGKVKARIRGSSVRGSTWDIPDQGGLFTVRIMRP